MKNSLERILENGLFFSRWLMAPVYVGLALALAGLVIVFARELIHEGAHIMTMDPEKAILAVLSLIDLSLAGNLLLIVIFSGYENFVSRIDKADMEDRPEWMGTVDFSALKLKLVASIVAISGIALLKSFLELGDGMEFDAVARDKLMWQVIVHLTFVVSGVLLALMDWLTGHQKD